MLTCEVCGYMCWHVDETGLLFGYIWVQTKHGVAQLITGDDWDLAAHGINQGKQDLQAYFVVLNLSS